MIPSYRSTLPSKLERLPSHPSSLSSRTLSRSSSQRRPASASTSSSSLCRVSQVSQAQDYFTPSLHRTRSHSSTDLRTRRQRQRLSLDSFDTSLLNTLHNQRRSYVTVPRPRPRSTGPNSTSTKESIKTCPTTIAAAEEMTILFNHLASALKAEIEVIFDNDGSVDMLGSLNTG